MEVPMRRPSKLLGPDGPRSATAGFTLLEVLIAMSILAVGATSVLAIFVAAVRFHTDRVEESRIVDLYNHAVTHAQVAFDAFDPSAVQAGQPKLPGKITADLRDTALALEHPDPLVREAAPKFKGFQYAITFEDNDLAVQGSSVVANIEIFGLSGRKDESFSHKQFLTRSGAPVAERFKVPSIGKRDRDKARPGG
jgi:prepilin-type N-terminal cleavage/methylation domain-containing protein